MVRNRHDSGVSGLLCSEAVLEPHGLLVSCDLCSPSVIQWVKSLSHGDFEIEFYQEQRKKK